jgi:hypothetical protein
MKTQMTVLALAATTLGALAACDPDTSTSSASPTATRTLGAEAARPAQTLAVPRTLPSILPTHSHATPAPSKSSPKPSSSTTTSSPKSARIVSFTLAQKPKCAEGTAVFRAPAVPAVIKWKITGATSAALSVDDPTHTAGTYGPEPLSGTETFDFTCAGPVGSTEKHTYAIYTVGGGKQHSLTITATAKILDKGKS